MTYHACECGRTEIIEDFNPPKACEYCPVCETVPWSGPGRPDRRPHDWDDDNVCSRCFTTVEQEIEDVTLVLRDSTTKKVMQ